MIRNWALATTAASALLVAAAPVGAQTAQQQIQQLQQMIQQQQGQIQAQQRALDSMQQQLQSLQQTATQANETAQALAEGKPVVRSGKSGIEVSLSGQVNRGILYYDDGADEGFLHVDNDNSSTRFRIIGKGDLNDDISVGTQIEVQFESNSTAAVNQFTDRGVGPNNFTERKLELYVDSDTLGRVWVGQGDTASNGTSEQDLSGTSVIGYSGLADMAGGLLFSVAGMQPALGNPTVGATFSNMDGLSRDDRIRYDTPKFFGFQGSTSAAADDRWDVALRYAGKLLQTKIAAAIAYWDRRGLDGVNGSISALHDSGINLTFASGATDRDGAGTRDSSFWYVKAGLLRAWFAGIGDTGINVDYYSGDEIGAVGEESSSWGAYLVQHVDKIATEFYLGGRVYDLDRPGTNFDDIVAGLVGARIKF